MIDELFRELCSLEEVEALALGGSRAGELFDAASDYDVYVYCRGPVPEEKRREILSRYCCVMEIGNHFWEYEDNCRLNDGVDIDLLYRDLDGFISGVAEVVERFQAHNGYTTCMWHNLLTCRIVYDRDGRLARAKERFDVPYPPQLQSSILTRSWALLHEAMPAYDGQIRKAVKRGDWVSVNHRTAAFLESYFDFLLALNKLPHPGEKRLVQICRERCGILPARFEENLTQLFQDLFSAPDRIADDLDALVTELRRTAEQWVEL